MKKPSPRVRSLLPKVLEMVAMAIIMSNLQLDIIGLLDAPGKHKVQLPCISKSKR